MLNKDTNGLKLKGWKNIYFGNTNQKKSGEKKKKKSGGFPGGAVVKNPPANAGDTGSSPGPGRAHMPRST